MAHLWIRDDSERWAVMPLESEAVSLTEHPPQLAKRPAGQGAARARIVLRRAAMESGAVWVLIAGSESGAYVNGAPVTLGMRAVADRDEIRADGAGAVFFSTETLARVERFMRGERSLFCPRCKQEVERETPAVKCPQCGVWYHQSDELPCWTYSETCALCPQTTDMEAGYQWTPEEL